MDRRRRMTHQIEHHQWPGTSISGRGKATSARRLLRCMSPHVARRVCRPTEGFRSVRVSTPSPTPCPSSRLYKSGPRPIQARRQVGRHRPRPLVEVSRRHDGSLVRFRSSWLSGWRSRLTYVCFPMTSSVGRLALDATDPKETSASRISRGSEPKSYHRIMIITLIAAIIAPADLGELGEPMSRRQDTPAPPGA